MASFTNGLRLFLKAIWKVLCFLLVGIVVFMTVVMSAQIAMRALGIQSFKWSEEVLRYSYIWVVFLGVPVGVYSNDLIRFDLLQTKLPPFAGKVLETALIAVMLTILFFMARGAFTLIRVQMRQMMTSLNIPMGMVYLCLPACALPSMSFLLAKVFLLWAGQPDLNAEGVEP